ncbi:cobalamin biosynthesis protein CobG [Streptomyces syringium]|uniref:cobalamin biosynthesis protein CobG n=1 Tax=Streptomyces syringium TaxID=76729 RepID=UPI003F536B95
MLAAMPVTPTSPPERDKPAAGGRTVRAGGDACPGALRLHTADDGALARVRLPAGLLTARQAVALALVAEELGDGNLDITSRGNVQLRGLADGCGGELASRLRGAGLLPSDRHDRVRNVAASPLCGLDGAAEPSRAGATDVQAWARALDALLCTPAFDAPAPSDGLDLSGLSGRFLFGLDDGRGDIVALGPDVTLIASGEEQAVLCFAATGPGLRIAASDAPRAAALAAREFLAALTHSGTRAWRVRDLAPEHRPRVEALADRLTAAGIASVALPLPRLPHGSPVGPGLVTGRDGRCALSVTAPLGRLTAAQWRLVATTAAQDGTGELRVTPWRGIVVPGLPAGTAGTRLTALADAGLVTSTTSPWHRAGACAGRPGCAKSLADVRADAAACLAGLPPAGLPVYWSGCERRCGHPGGTWVDVLATGDGYRIAVRDGDTETGPETEVSTAHTTAGGLADAVAAARTSAD